MNTISLPPIAPVLMEATRAIGYSIETAISDIIDNSITAIASEVNIDFFPNDGAYISILDNGSGMNESELINAMRFGSRDPLETRSKADLGRFGLGLKTASLSQCRKLTVISKKNGTVAGAQWDLDFIATTGDWTLRLLDTGDIETYPHTGELNRYSSGTIVLWQELDRLKVGEADFDSNMGKKMDLVREHISLVFHRYLSGELGLKRVGIYINNRALEALDPFLIGKSTQSMDDEIININGERIVVRPYILPHSSQLDETELRMLGGKEGLRKQQGFYVYRNKRLLVWGSWFRLMRQGELSKLARVRVDIPNSLDYLWALDIKKSTALPPEIVRKNLANIIEKIAEGSKRTWVYRGRREIDDSKIHVWSRVKTREGGVIYEVNRDYPLVEAISSMGFTEKKAIEHLLAQIERGLPLNQLYVDLTSDERIVNDSEVSKDDLFPMFKQLISGCKNLRERAELIRRLSVTEPFNQYPEWFSEPFQEVE